MKYFLTKASIIVISPIVLSIFIFFSIPQIITPKNDIPDGFIKSIEKTKIIVAGDSRADRQIDPRVIQQNTNSDILNIASTGWDLYSLSKMLLKTNVHDKIIVISASYFQFNDGAIDNGYLSLESYSDLSILQKVFLYSQRLDELFSIQLNLFEQSISSNYSNYYFGNYHRKNNLEFDEQECESFEISSTWFDHHPWYKSPNTAGIKMKLLLKSLDNLSSLKNCKVLIYNGPVSDKFIKYGSPKGIIDMEKKYDSFMSSMCKKRGIVYHSFLGDSSLTDLSLYYDPQHLCKKGVPLFSNKISDLLYKLNYVNLASNQLNLR
jgi:hypothetical protein